MLQKKPLRKDNNKDVDSEDFSLRRALDASLGPKTLWRNLGEVGVVKDKSTATPKFTAD